MRFFWKIMKVLSTNQPTSQPNDGHKGSKEKIGNKAAKRSGARQYLPPSNHYFINCNHVSPDLNNFVLIVGMIGIAGVQEVELGVVDLVLLDPVLELFAISGNEAGSLVDNVAHL